MGSGGRAGAAIGAVAGAATPAGVLGGVAGGIIGNKIGNGSLDIGNPLEVPTADQSRINAAIEAIKQQREQSQGILAGQQQQVSSSLNKVNDSLGLLQGAAQGTAPSMAQGILQQGLDQGINAQAALANSGSMANQLVRQRQAADTGAQLTQQTANQAGMLRAQEMATARSAYNQGAQNLYGTNVGAQQSTQGILGNLATGQANAATGGVALAQSAVNQTAANNTSALGGLLNGAGSAGAAFASEGTKVPGEEIVKGDSKKNDVYHYLLSAGEIVIPKSATKSMDSAIKFLEKYIDTKSEKSEKD